MVNVRDEKESLESADGSDLVDGAQCGSRKEADH